MSWVVHMHWTQCYKTPHSDGLVVFTHQGAHKSLGALSANPSLVQHTHSQHRMGREQVLRQKRRVVCAGHPPDKGGLVTVGVGLSSVLDGAGV